MRFRNKFKQRNSLLLALWGCALLLAYGAAPCSRAAGEAPLQMTLQERRERLRTMDAAEKERLQRQKERFDQLPPEEKQRLREIHEALAAAPDGVRVHPWTVGRALQRLGWTRKKEDPARRRAGPPRGRRGPAGLAAGGA